MTKWKNVIVSPNNTIIETMKIIDESSLQFSVVVDEFNRLLGTVTDGDIRRGILKGLSLKASVDAVMNNDPIFEYEGKNHFYYKNVLEQKRLKQLPIVNKQGQLITIIFSDEFTKIPYKKNTVVLMAGGLGTRLRPLTNDIPKPMLTIGNKPILETIIESFKSYGFINFILTVNYKKEQIKDYFQDGSHLGVNISYIDENKRLGTAGALSLLNEIPNQPFFVMNGDLLTKINYEQLLEFHKDTKSTATMCVREHEYQIPFGVIETNNYRLTSIKEKPTYKKFVNAGIYVLNPEVIEFIPQNEFFDMPELFNKIMENEEEEICAFPLREYWMDIGRMDDYEKANGDFLEVFE